MTVNDNFHRYIYMYIKQRDDNSFIIPVFVPDIDTVENSILLVSCSIVLYKQFNIFWSV